MELSVVWWNTSLSPPKAKTDRLTNEDKAVALEVLAEFIVEQSVDLIGLCEVSQANVDWLRPICESNGYLLQSGIVKAGQGRSKFDSCVIYKAVALRFVEQVQLTYAELRRTSKVGLHLMFTIVGDDRPIHVFISHWPSRLKPNDMLRVMLGQRLRSSVDDILAADPKSLILIMGDFNDEPFDESLAGRLMATRDRALVSKEPLLLYNPFWRHLGGRDEYHHSSIGSDYAGTHYFGGDNKDRWRTFDQIIVSSAFVGNSEWHLDEASIEIVDMPSYTPHVLDPGKIFDHLPVKVVFERVANNG